MKKIINSAIKYLENGKLIIFPTETVYGLGGDATNNEAIKSIYKLKKRPMSNPLICHFPNILKIEENFFLNSLDRNLAKVFWPGPLTLILKKKSKSKISKLVSNKKNLVGCRIPNNLVAIELLNKLSFPLAAPSANMANKLSTTRYQDIPNEIIENSLLIKGKKTTLGLESTVIKTHNNTINILRVGSITKEEIEYHFPNNKIEENIEINSLSPGNQKKHYSPNLPIRINIKIVKINEVLLNFGENKLKSNIYEFNLSKSSDLKEAANNFFHYLNILDKINCKGIAVAPIPDIGLGKAINDRLRRAIEND